jgi:hypothetical protein
MKRFKVLVAATFMVVTAAIYALPAKTASAVDVIPAASTSSASLGIVPRKDYTIEPGSSVKDTLVINNLDTDAPLDIGLRVIDFTYTGDGGTPKLMLAADAPQTTWSLKPYITIPSTVTVAAGATKTINLDVSIPANVGAGSYYSAILYNTGNADGGNVGLSASGVSLVFVSVPGKVNESLTLQKLGAYDISNPTLPKFVTFASVKPTQVAYTLKNAGNVTEAPVGTITMKYMFGQTTTISNVNSSSSLALIGQTRTFATCIKLQPATVNVNGASTTSTTCATPDIWPGRYTLKLDVYYGQNGNTTQEVVGTAIFWYLPIWFDVTVAILILVILFVIWRIYHLVNRKLYGPRNSSRRR